jgi:hypothetical protein
MHVLGPTWMYLDELGCTWIYLDILGCTWMYLDVLGYTWIYLDVELCRVFGPFLLGKSLGNTCN